MWLKHNSSVISGKLRCSWENVRLVRYVDEQVSPENTLLVAWQL